MTDREINIWMPGEESTSVMDSHLNAPMATCFAFLKLDAS